MIELKNIYVEYDGQAVINNLTFTFEDGLFYGISGTSGIGKTTLINVIANLTKYRSGYIVNTHKKISYIFQDARLFPWMTALENVECVCKDKEKASYYLNLLLSDNDNKYPYELSGGMKQRVAIARALSYDASLILLDEPFKGLDYETKQATKNIVLEQIKNKTAILISHEESELSMCNKVYKMDNDGSTLLTEVKSGS